ncbi:MAG: cupin-like domain-containing protein [Cyclobacteriaceae bacterium]
MIDKVHNYDDSLPKLNSTFATKRWSALFMYDQTFSITAKVKDPESDNILCKVHNGSKMGKRFLNAHIRNVKELINQNKRKFSKPVELPSLLSRDITIEGFNNWKRNIGLPLVVKGYLKDAPILDLMSVSNFANNFGHKEVKCVKFPDQEDSSYIGQNLTAVTTFLNEFLTSDQYADHYINNYYGLVDEDIFLNDCKGLATNELMGLNHILSQWFISRPDHRYRTPLHCAGSDNVFLNVIGRKEWHFIDPSYTAIMQPAMSKYGSYCVSELQDPLIGDFYENFTNKYSEMSHVPIYKIVLEPGDMLYNPAWWWHRVSNLSPLNIGCATRYKDIDILVRNSPTLWAGLMIEIFKHPRKSLLAIANKSLSDKKNAYELIDSIFSKKVKPTT